MPPMNGTHTNTVKPSCSLCEYFIFNKAKLININIVKVIKLVIFAKLNKGNDKAKNKTTPVIMVVAISGVWVIALISPILSGNHCFRLMP